MLNILRIWGYALLGLINAHRKFPEKVIIIMHGSWIGEKSESFLHAHTIARLYAKNRDHISYIIASGYDATSDSLETEGQYMANVLIENGVPREIIIIEGKALSTTENIVRSISLLREKGLAIHGFNIIPIHRPSYIWKTYYLWNMLEYKIYMAIASAEPIRSFLKNAKVQKKNIRAFLKNPIQNELNTAQLRSETRTHFDIEPLTIDELRAKDF
jgi:hypothetical protein